ncbi:Cache 3/Cache 2 fusion domain-containing protein, partial [Luteimonas sp. SJ-92]
MHGIRQLSLGAKLATVVAAILAGALLLLALLAYRQSAEGLQTRADGDLAAATGLVQESVAMYDEALVASTRHMAGLFEALLPAGELVLDPEETLEVGATIAPTLRLGDSALNLDFEAVDRFADATGGVATMFARDGDDFVRVTTSLRNADGERAIGTRLDHGHPAYSLLLGGEAYTGPAHLFGSDYMTHYAPMRDASGEIAAVLFVGQDATEGLAALRQRVRASATAGGGSFYIVALGEDGRPGQVLVHSRHEGTEFPSLVPGADLAALDAVLAGNATSARIELDGAAHLVSARAYAPRQWVVLGAEPVDAIEASLATLLRNIGAISLLALAIGIGLMLLAVRRLVSRPLAGAERVAMDVAEGRLDGTIDVTTGDEVGRLLESMRKMQAQLQAVMRAQTEMALRHDEGQISHRMDEAAFPGDYGRMVHDTNALVAAHIGVKMRLIQIMGRYAVGDLSEDMDRLPGEKAVLSETMDAVKSNLQAINGEIRRLVGAAGEGDFTARGDAARFEHDFREMVEGLNRLMQTTDGNLAEVSTVLKAIAEGDLTVRMDGEFRGVFARMRDDANATVAQLADIVGRIHQASSAINIASTEIASGNSDLSRRTEQQAANLEETAASMEELTSTVKQNAEHA